MGTNCTAGWPTSMNTQRVTRSGRRTAPVPTTQQRVPGPRRSVWNALRTTLYKDTSPSPTRKTSDWPRPHPPAQSPSLSRMVHPVVADQRSQDSLSPAAPTRATNPGRSQTLPYPQMTRGVRRKVGAGNPGEHFHMAVRTKQVLIQAQEDPGNSRFVP